MPFEQTWDFYISLRPVQIQPTLLRNLNFRGDACGIRHAVLVRWSGFVGFVAC